MKITWHTKKIPELLRLVVALLLLFGVVLIVVIIRSTETQKSPAMVGNTSTPTVIKPSRSVSEFPPSYLIQKQYPLSIQIDQVISYTDRYFVKGTITQSDSSNGVLKSVDFNQMNLFDATGKQIAIEPINFAYSPSPKGAQFSFYTTEKGVAGDWTLIIPSLDFYFHDTGNNFSVDFGTNPKPGDEIEVIKEFNVSGHRFWVDSLKILTWEDRVRVQFRGKGEEGLRSLSILEVNSDLRDSSSFSTQDLNDYLVDLDYYSGDYKPGTQKFEIKNLTFFKSGNWRVNFRLDEIAHPGTVGTSEFNNACLSGSQVDTLLNQAPEPFPKNSSGHLLAQDYSSSHKKTSILLLPDLIAQKEFSFSYSDDSFLSPDGTTIAYYKSDEQKIVLDNWIVGQEAVIPLETYVYPDGIIFSDDSSEISFQISRSIRTINTRNLKTEFEIPQTLSPIRWLEKGQILLAIQYVPKSGGGYLYTVNAITGETNSLLTGQKIIEFVSVSPDKKQIVYSDSIVDTNSQGLFISSIGSKDRRLLLFPNGPYYLRSISWSPDGKWLLIDLFNAGHPTKHVLLDPLTCEAHLLNIGDVVISQWVN
jgi:hypothetical protein